MTEHKHDDEKQPLRTPKDCHVLVVRRCRCGAVQYNYEYPDGFTDWGGWYFPNSHTDV